MARKPVNSLNVELLSELKALLLEAQNSRNKGVILTSSLPTVFSAGLDIMEMFTTDKEKLIDFWQAVQDTWLTVYSLTIPIAAAVNVQSFKYYFISISLQHLIQHSFLYRALVLLEAACWQCLRNIESWLKVSIL